MRRPLAAWIVVGIGLLVGATSGVAPARAQNQPPDCTAAMPSATELWPPNHKLATVAVGGVTDPDGDPVSVTVTGIAQDEPIDGTGDGNTCADGFGVGTGAASLRAERSGGGDGRVYHVSFSADDGLGGSCDGAFVVCVPHDQGRGSGCGDQGPLVDSTGPLPDDCSDEDCGPEDCAPDPEDLDPASCQGAELPARLARRVSRASELLERAGESRSKHRKGRLAKRAGHLLRSAGRKAAGRHDLPPDCAAMLHDTLTDAGRCAVCQGSED